MMMLKGNLQEEVVGHHVLQIDYLEESETFRSFMAMQQLQEIEQLKH